MPVSVSFAVLWEDVDMDVHVNVNEWNGDGERWMGLCVDPD